MRAKIPPSVRPTPIQPITDCPRCRCPACRTSDLTAATAGATSRSDTPAPQGSRASAPHRRAVERDGRSLMGEWLVWLVVHRDRRPSLVEDQLVTVTAQALMEVGTCTAALTNAFVARLPVACIPSLSRLIFTKMLFLTAGLFHRSSSHHCTWLVHSALTHRRQYPQSDGGFRFRGGPEVPSPPSPTHLDLAGVEAEATIGEHGQPVSGASGTATGDPTPDPTT